MRGKTKRRAALLAAVFCIGAAGMAAPTPVMAAQNVQSAELTAVVTTQRCSIWSAPATVEGNRVKYVEAGYQILVYPEAVASELEDGKTFYRTMRGSYVLCRCVTGGGGSAAGTANASGAADGSGTALAIPPMPEAPSLDRASVRSERKELWAGTGANADTFASYGITEYDASGNAIKTAIYRPDGTLSGYEAMEYDALGNRVKLARYEPDGATVTQLCVDEYDVSGNRIRSTIYEADGSVSSHSVWGYDASGNLIREVKYYDGAVRTNDSYEYNAQGNRIRWTSYRADGTIVSEVRYDYDALGNRTRATTYRADGSIERITTYHADGTIKDIEWL